MFSGRIITLSGFKACTIAAMRHADEFGRMLVSVLEA